MQVLFENVVFDVGICLVRYTLCFYFTPQAPRGAPNEQYFAMILFISPNLFSLGKAAYVLYLVFLLWCFRELSPLAVDWSSVLAVSNVHNYEKHMIDLIAVFPFLCPLDPCSC